MDYKVVFLVAVMIASVLSIPYEPPVPVAAVDHHAPKCPCAKIYLPMCGSDGITYNNECEFLCQKKHVRHLGGPELYVVKLDRCEEIDY